MWNWLYNMFVWYTATDPYEEDATLLPLSKPEIDEIFKDLELSPTEYIESFEIKEETSERQPK